MVVDSSKLPTYGYLLHQVPSVRIRVVHLVRDPRATAHSWQRLRATGAVDDDDEAMDRFGVWKATALWDIWNTTGPASCSKRSPDYLRVRYEDLVADPRHGDRRPSARSPACRPTTRPSSTTAPCVLEPNHAVAGNPNRRRAGDVDASSRTTSGARR